MPVVKSMIRNSSKKIFCFIFLIFIFCVAVLYFNIGIINQRLEIRDITSTLLPCFSILTIVILSHHIHSLIIFGFEDFRRGQNSNVLNKLKNHLATHECLCIFICVDLAVCCCLGWLWLHMELKFSWSYILVIIPTSILSACMTLLVDYDDVELALSQKIEKSIGATWAHGAYSAFYKKILSDITKRMSEFEEKKGVKLLVEKLVLICPLSCNANGSLDGKDGALEDAGNLGEMSDDEGANINRSLKTNVYKIRGPSEAYIAAEIPSPLATLYEMRDVMDSVILQYHRECFIETLEDLLKGTPSIILKYDDLNSHEPLHSFLLSKLEDKRFISVTK